MAENKITGFVVVESEEALRAFEREMESLKKEFLEAGFEGAELEFSLSEGGDQRWQETQEGTFHEGMIAATRYEASSTKAETEFVSVTLGDGAVDVLA
jgi:flagellar hook-length control protein FliK